MNIYVHAKSSYLNRTSIQAVSGYFLIFRFLVGPIQSLSQGADITNHTIFFYYIPSEDGRGREIGRSVSPPADRTPA